MRTVQMPRWVAVCLAIATLASVTVAFSQLAGYTLTKPFTLEISTEPSPLSVVSINFLYDPAVNQWVSCNMNVDNANATAMTAKVYVYLKDASGTNVAQGQLTQTFPHGTTTITVTLSWQTGKTVDDVAGGYVVIQP